MKAIYKVETSDGVREYTADVTKTVEQIKADAQHDLGVTVFDVIHERPLGAPPSIDSEYKLPLTAIPLKGKGKHRREA